MNAYREWILRPRKVQMSLFRAWALKYLKTGDAVVLETTANVWDIYDIVSSLVSKTVVANAYKVRQIAEARVKTDKEDVKRLITLLMNALLGLSRQQFIKYGLLRLGIGYDLTRIERNGFPRRIAPADEVLLLRPDLKPPS